MELFAIGVSLQNIWNWFGNGGTRGVFLQKIWNWFDYVSDPSKDMELVEANNEVPFTRYEIGWGHKIYGIGLAMEVSLQKIWNWSGYGFPLIWNWFSYESFPSKDMFVIGVSLQNIWNWFGNGGGGVN